MRRHHASLSVLLPMLAGLVACGGSVATVDGASSSGGGSSGGGTSGTSGSSSSGGASGSSGSSGSSGVSSGGSSGTVPYDVDLCAGGTGYQMLDGVTPAPGAVPVDYMELRDEYQSTTPQKPIVVAKSGTPCASSSDKVACQTAVAETRSAGWPVHSVGMEMPRERYLLATIRDTIELATSTDDLKAFIAPIDTAKDAALLVTATGKYRIVCGTSQARKTSTGWEIVAQSGHTCGSGTKVEEHVFAVTNGGDVYTMSTKLIKEGDPNCAIGRRPAGLAERPTEVDARRDGDSALGRFFAEAAYLEAASVFAFDRLADELVELGAPADLVATARVSREDEVRHARMTSKLARRFGAEVASPVVAPPERRSAFEIALENAVEGCVRETFGALVAHWQTRRAGDAGIARVMKAIAEDETRHAALAWDVAAWLEPQLSPEERRAVEAARARATRELRAELFAETDADLVAIAGMPRPQQAIALLDALERRHLAIAA